MEGRSNGTERAMTRGREVWQREGHLVATGQGMPAGEESWVEATTATNNFSMQDFLSDFPK